MMDRFFTRFKNRVKKSGQTQNRRLIESSIKSGLQKKKYRVKKKSGKKIKKIRIYIIINKYQLIFIKYKFLIIIIHYLIIIMHILPYLLCNITNLL